MFIAGLFFSFMNLGVKLIPGIPVLEIVFFRAAFMVAVTLFLLRRKGINPLGNNRKLLFLRGILGASALSLYFYALQNMPLASAVTIMQLSPIFTTLFAVVILKEKIKPIQLLFFLISFIGVIFIKGFDSRISFSLLLIALSGSILSALAYNVVRKLKETEHHLVVVFYFPFIALPLSGIYTAFHFVMPVGYQWLILLIIGISTQKISSNGGYCKSVDSEVFDHCVRYLVQLFIL